MKDEGTATAEAEKEFWILDCIGLEVEIANPDLLT